ncbi:chitin deacetylase 1 [Lepeophtheirus salmonis]|uniref:Chitin-binding type-2 domain-containing protein n=1 Tax=Lepeophtheirus salmonis TaxID=72036 RepID=A0A0K2UHK3_LEPSM|nr:chitin deacetylase 1-like [Lepeophtheirus salmonis]
MKMFARFLILALSFEFIVGANNNVPSSEEAIEELCSGRPSSEYFRLSTDGDCRAVYRCDSHGVGGSEVRLAEVKCPSGLSFDIGRQTCDWKNNVYDCDQLSKPRLSKPKLVTLEPLCSEGEDYIQCGSGECKIKTAYCDGTPDCNDGSDENVCSFNEDPNKVAECDLSQCVLPDCYCSADGTRIPGNTGEEDATDVNQTPQMIVLSFNGAVTGINAGIYDKIFNEERVNPNGCSVKGTFFVSHKFTNYSAVQELHRRGHDIGVFSISNKDNTKYWTEPEYDDWLSEMAGGRLIIESFSNITDGSVVGVRCPYLFTGGNTQFEVMADQFFAYDSSITAPLSNVPIWPYTLHYRIPHACTGSGHCPSRAYPIWELPINELDRRDDPDFDEILTGCSLVSSCSNIYEADQFKRLLQHNFNRHYSSNRAPLSLSFDASWLQSKKGFVNTLTKWMDETLSEKNDVYFVSQIQVIQWMQNPTTVTSLREFEEWKTACKVGGQPLCSLPNPCPLTTRELPGEVHRLHTCMSCPDNYPWVLDPTGKGFSLKK